LLRACSGLAPAQLRPCSGPAPILLWSRPLSGQAPNLAPALLRQCSGPGSGSALALIRPCCSFVSTLVRPSSGRAPAPFFLVCFAPLAGPSLVCLICLCPPALHLALRSSLCRPCSATLAPPFLPVLHAWLCVSCYASSAMLLLRCFSYLPSLLCLSDSASLA
jgi:hypothetical protein